MFVRMLEGAKEHCVRSLFNAAVKEASALRMRRITRTGVTNARLVEGIPCAVRCGISVGASDPTQPQKLTIHSIMSFR